MKEQNFKSDHEKLSTLLRESRSNPSLPPRFQEHVWRRIENAEKRTSATNATWLDVISGMVLRPRVAFAVAALLVLVGIGLGWSSGEQLARQDAQARYVTAVAPNSLR